jgi:hypothetical protein
MHDYYEQMRQHLDRHDQSRVSGLSTRDVVAQNYSEQELHQMITSMHERPVSTLATFRLWSFIFERQQERVPEQFRRSAADALADCFTSSGQRLDSSAVEIFIVWGSHRPEHRLVCLSLLRHPDAEIRRTAVSCAGGFLRPVDFYLLFEFRNDPDISEISMCGPLRYVLRDYALEVLERLTHCPVKGGGDCFEETPNGRVSYRSWSLFLAWYESQKRRFTNA